MHKMHKIEETLVTVGSSLHLQMHLLRPKHRHVLKINCDSNKMMPLSKFRYFEVTLLRSVHLPVIKWVSHTAASLLHIVECYYVSALRLCPYRGVRSIYATPYR